MNEFEVGEGGLDSGTFGVNGSEESIDFGQYINFDYVRSLDISQSIEVLELRR